MNPPWQLRTTLVALKPGCPDFGASETAARLAAGGRLVRLDVPDHGVPAVEITRAAEREQADLIVLGREPRDLVESTVRRARVPCLVVPCADTGFRRILAAVDAGPNSTEIFDVAAAMGELLGSEVEAIHVERGAPLPAATRSWAVRPGGAGVATALEMLVCQGDPVTEILRTVGEEEIELLVFGHHRGGPRNAHETGSIAARLLQRAPCAVLTVPI